MPKPLDAICEQIVRDFWEKPLPELTVRDARLPALEGKVDAIVGMRRSGKTYFLFQEIRCRLAEGIAKERLLYVNFEDERLLPLDAGDLHQLTDALFRLRPGLREETIWLFLDEVQNVPGWERFVRRLLDAGRIRLAVTGSSSKLLAREVATSLRGRGMTTEMFPFSFGEVLRNQGIKPPSRGRPSSKTRSLLENRFRVYLSEGGFPEVQTMQEDHRVRVLRDYVDVAVFRDVVERHGVSNIPALMRMVRHLLTSDGCLFSVHKFYNDLRSQGIRVAKDTMYAYLEHLSDAYLVLPVPAHAASERARMANPPKIYAIDTGLAGVFAPKDGADQGRRLESLAHSELRRRGYKLEYLKTRTGREVDFLATPLRGEVRLVQVSLSLRDQAVREREVRALREAMAAQSHDALIVTLNEDDEIRVPEGVIQVVPAWAWALGIE